MTDNNIQEQPSYRLLRFALVLSMIGSGLYLVNYLLTGLLLPVIQSAVEAGQISYPQEFTVAVEQMLRTPRPYSFSMALLEALSLVGVIRMWRLYRNGFHVYALSQLLMLLVTGLFLGRQYVMLGDIMMTLLFITIYFVCFRRLGLFSREVEPVVDDDDEEDDEDDEEDDENDLVNGE